MARINDLERGFEKTLAYAYGKHVVQGHLIMHNIDIIGSEKQVTLLMALGDGAYNNQGEGAWGIEAQGGGEVEEPVTIPNPVLRVDARDYSFTNGSEITSLVDTGSHDYTVSRYAPTSTIGPTFINGSPKSIKFGDTTNTTRGFKIPSTNADLSLSGNFTIVLGIYVPSVMAAHQTLQDILVRYSSSADDGYQLSLRWSGSFGAVTGAWLNFYTQTDGGNTASEFVQDSHFLNPNTFYIVSLVYNGTGIPKMYVNQAEAALDEIWIGNGPYVPPGPVAGATATIGTGGTGLTNIGQNYYQGQLPYVGVWNQSLSIEQLNAVEKDVADDLGLSGFVGGGSEEDPGTGIIGAGDAIEAVYYAGRLISPTNWHYHPGTFSRGVDDPIQGVDPYFPDGITYSGTAYITIRLPVGVADDADPSKVAVVLKTSCIADYDINGDLTEIGYSANPARVKADMLKRRGQHTRINWDSYIQARDWYDGLLNWESGDTTNVYSAFSGTPTFIVSGNAQFSSSQLSKLSSVTGYDNVIKTIQRIATGEDGWIKLTVGGSFGPSTSGFDFHLIDPSNRGWFGVSVGNGHMSIFANNVAIDDADIPYDFPVSNGDTITLEVSGGEFVLKHNDNVIIPDQGISLAPLDKDLIGRVILHHSGAVASSILMEGHSIASTSQNTTQVPRFEAHPAFTSAVDLTTGMDFVDSLCASDTQDAGDEIIFITPATPAPRVSSFTFTEDVNVVAGTLRVFKRDIRERPNRISAQFRNLDKVYLDQDEVFESRDELFDELGYIIDPGALNFASMNGSQAQRLIKYNMRRMSDRDIFCELTGMSDSFKLLAGDIVTVESDKLPNGLPKDFIILQVNRESGESTAYERTFVLQEWFADDYKDTDHGPQQGTTVEPVPSPFDLPPAPVVLLEQSTEIAGDTLTTKVNGKVYFSSYLYAQTAKIYVTPPGGSEVDAGITATPSPGTNLGTFEYVTSVLEEYQFRAEAISYTGVVGGSDTETITIGDVIIDDITEDVIAEDGSGSLLVDG